MPRRYVATLRIAALNGLEDTHPVTLEITKMKTIILASSSPRRKELLEQIGLQFEVALSEYPEVLRPGVPPHELAMNMSLEKAKAVAARHPGSIIIAADTFGLLRGKIIGKPHTDDEARKTLHSLSGKMHRVITGFTILDTAENKLVSRSVETKVYFKKLTAGEIDNYVKSGEPLDKAGAYAIQGLGAVLVEKISGDYYNVIGLPLSPLAECLKEFGISVF
jgi:septum formation protein